jgi:hypothetical protein
MKIIKELSKIELNDDFNKNKLELIKILIKENKIPNLYEIIRHIKDRHIEEILSGINNLTTKYFSAAERIRILENFIIGDKNSSFQELNNMKNLIMFLKEDYKFSFSFKERFDNKHNQFQAKQDKNKEKQKRMYTGLILYSKDYKNKIKKEIIIENLKELDYSEEEIKEIENYFKRYKKLLTISKMVKEELNGKIETLEKQNLIILQKSYIDKLNDLEKNINLIKNNKIIETNLETKFLIYLLKNYNLIKPESEKLFNPKDLEEIAKQFIKENNERKLKFKEKQEKLKQHQTKNQNNELVLE